MIEIKRHLRGPRENLAEELFEPGFKDCKLYRRQTAFFRPSILKCWSTSLQDIVENETKLEILKPNKCKSFASLIKNKKVKNYIDDRKPKKETLKNLKVTVLYINHDYETRDGLSSSLVKLWEDLFKYVGVENYEIVKQLDIQ